MDISSTNSCQVNDGGGRGRGWWWRRPGCPDGWLVLEEVVAPRKGSRVAVDGQGRGVMLGVSGGGGRGARQRHGRPSGW